MCFIETESMENLFSCVLEFDSGIDQTGSKNHMYLSPTSFSVHSQKIIHMKILEILLT